MDPNEALKRMLQLSADINSRVLTPDELVDSAFELAELVEDFNTWIDNGGPLPDDWDAAIKKQ